MSGWVCAALLAAACSATAATSPAACAPCHAAETARFAAAAMTHALSTAADSAVLHRNPRLAARVGAYSYEIAGGILTVSDGQATLREPLEWAFGEGTVGQTYLFRHDGEWYESRVSYFATLPGLDITLGQDSITPHNLLEAAGRRADLGEVGKCFDCHATNVGKARPLNLPAMVAGVQCERCHGASSAHLETGASMKKLGTADAEGMSEFCGQCHRTWGQVATNGPRGVSNVRFQPYRLALSKCYDTSDRRIRCTACHDPHASVETSAAKYDVKCGACHAAPAKVCRVAAKDCVTCHLPKIELPGAHRRFTDHRIRVVHSNEAYPD